MRRVTGRHRDITARRRRRQWQPPQCSAFRRDTHRRNERQSRQRFHCQPRSLLLRRQCRERLPHRRHAKSAGHRQFHCRGLFASQPCALRWPRSPHRGCQRRLPALRRKQHLSTTRVRHRCLQTAESVRAAAAAAAAAAAVSSSISGTRRSALAASQQCLQQTETGNPAENLPESSSGRRRCWRLRGCLARGQTRQGERAAADCCVGWSRFRGRSPLFRRGALRPRKAPVLRMPRWALMLRSAPLPSQSMLLSHSSPLPSLLTIAAPKICPHPPVPPRHQLRCGQQSTIQLGFAGPPHHRRRPSSPTCQFSRPRSLRAPRRRRCGARRQRRRPVRGRCGW